MAQLEPPLATIVKGLVVITTLGRMSRGSRREPSILRILTHSFGWQRLGWRLYNCFHLAKRACTAAAAILTGDFTFLGGISFLACSQLLVAVCVLSQLLVVAVGSIASAPQSWGFRPYAFLGKEGADRHQIQRCIFP